MFSASHTEVMEIIQIVPRLPPAIDGVGDYAYLLAQQMRKAHGIETVFVVCDPGWKGADSAKTEIRHRETEISKPATSSQQPSTNLDDFTVHQLRGHSAAELLQVLSQSGMPTTTLLHYVGYGYEKRGCPLWLVRALRAWKTMGRKSMVNSQPPQRLLTMFHELYAFGPLWRSSFWTSPVQRWIAQILARNSGHCFTNRAASATWLAGVSHHSANAISPLPVFSTVGEPEHLPDWNVRPSRLIVFGRASERRRAYFNHSSDLEAACRAMNLDEIVDIGAPFEIPPLSVRVSRRGILSAPEVSREMLAARAGFFAYHTAYLGKSTIFAAYAAHGLTPVTYYNNRFENMDDLKAGEHYLFTNDLKQNDAEITGKNTLVWYRQHNIKKQAEHFSKVITAMTGTQE